MRIITKSDNFVKVVHKQAVADDKKLQATFKRLGVNTIPGIDEVNLFKDDGTVIHFKNPKSMFLLCSLAIIIQIF